MTLLDRVPASKTKHSLEENLALIDSRIQYLDELRAENTATKTEMSDTKEEASLEKKNDDTVPLGQSIEFVESRGCFIIVFEVSLDPTLYVLSKMEISVCFVMFLVFFLWLYA